MIFSKILSTFFILAVFISFSPVKESHSVNKLTKQLIGSKKINFSTDHDVMFNNEQFPFKQIILEATTGAIEVNWLKIYYNSGHVQDVVYNRLIKAGNINVSTALTGTAVQKIEFGYVKNPLTVKGKPQPHKRCTLAISGFY